MKKYKRKLNKKAWLKIATVGVITTLTVISITYVGAYNKERIQSELAATKHQQELNDIVAIKNNEISAIKQAMELKDQEVLTAKKEIAEKTDDIKSLKQQMVYNVKTLEEQLTTTESKLNNVRSKLNTTRTELDTTQSRLLNAMNRTASTPSSTGSQVKSTATNNKKTILVKQQAGSVLTVEATAYTADCKGCSGITATGLDVRNKTPKIIAVDPNVIDLNRKVELFVGGKSLGVWETKDTGGDIKGFRIDLLKGSMSEALQFGRKHVTLKVLE